MTAIRMSLSLSKDENLSALLPRGRLAVWLGGDAALSRDTDRAADCEAEHRIGAAEIDGDLGEAVGILVPEGIARLHRREGLGMGNAALRCGGQDRFFGE